MSSLTLSLPSRRRAAGRLRSAFTLVEIMIVLAIIALLVGVTVGKFTGIFGRSQVKIAKLFVNSEIDTSMMSYREDMGDYPSTDEGLAALYVAPQDKADRWHGPYAKGSAPPDDPWGHPYHYLYPGVHNKDGYDLWSAGPTGTDGADTDIGNW